MTAAIAVGIAAVAALAWRAVRGQSLVQPLVGVAIVAIGAVVVAITGDARSFFLLPVMIPFAVCAVCAVSLTARRPLTGLLLNRVCGGPPDWAHRPLRRIYTATTVACLVVDAINAAIQLVFYERSNTAVLAVAHVATAPMFAAIVAVTVGFARRAIRAGETP